MFIFAALLALAGCQPKSDQTAGPISPGNRSGPPRANVNTSAGWPFWPARMRVHPATRLLKDQASSKPIVEARIEFFDAEGATSKAVGQLVIQLQSATPRSEPIQTWNQDLSDLTLNRRQYDEVFRTYLFRLEVDPEQIPEEPELRAYFLADDGQKLEATMKLKRSLE